MLALQNRKLLPENEVFDQKSPTRAEKAKN